MQHREQLSQEKKTKTESNKFNQNKSESSSPRQNGWRGVFGINRVRRYPWNKAITAGLTIGIPFIVGNIFGRLDWALLAGIGGFTALYVHNESYKQRAIKLLLVNIGLIISFGLGLVAAISPWTMALALSGVATISTFICGAFRVPPPSGYFFVLVCAVGTSLPVDLSVTLSRMTIALLGGCLAWVLSMSSWLFIPGNRERVVPLKDSSLASKSVRTVFRSALAKHSQVVSASYRNGLVILIATFIAYALGIERLYWVPLSCASVLQGATILAMLHRALQRSVGTVVGILIAGGIFALNPSFLMLGLWVITLQFVVELIIVRNYAFAVVFITPLALIIAESGQPNMPVSTLIGARLLDTLLGSAIGLMGAFLWRNFDKENSPTDEPRS
ncbi:FUSC family protein [Ectobacillus funiculus]|uniref:FUSC family protein n=1 Tax=Ectobacillus funiculus TaxID=137993 RepID=UPI00397DE3DA